MTTAADRRARRLASAALLGLALSGCRKPAEPETSPEVAQACASACAALVGAQCVAEVDPLSAQQLCVQGCLRSEKSSRGAGCSTALLSYLSCVAGSASLVCPASKLSAAQWLEQPSELAGCGAAGRAHRTCTRPCREAGVVYTASKAASDGSSGVQAEVVGLGCSDDARPPARKAAAGSPCTHYSVCTPARCECPNRRVAFLARACVAGRCAGAESACLVAPQAVGHELCHGPDPGGGG
jgi:hypothetical protein